MSSQPSQPSQSSQPGFADNIYSDAASLGRLKAFVGLIIGCIIAFIIFVVGLFKIFSTNKHTMDVKATITKIIQCQSLESKPVSYECMIDLSYTVNDVPYNISTFSTTGPSEKKVGQILTVYYDPENPSSVSIQSRSADQVLGWSMIGFSLLVVGMAYLFWWLTNRYKFFAAAEGAHTVSSLFRS
jgi:hypothetical protein